MKILTKSLIGPALDWACGMAAGRVLHEPQTATYEKVAGMRVPFQLWDVRCTYRGDALVSAEPIPIVVHRIGIDHSVGATAPSISFSDDTGCHARGGVEMFYLSRDDAQVAAKLMLVGGIDGFSPSTNWSDGGPIIESANITIIRADDEYEVDANGFTTTTRIPCWFAETDRWVGHTPATSYEGENMPPTFMVEEDDGCYGPTPLIAAMRAFVSFKLGSEVDVPDELMPPSDPIDRQSRARPAMR